MSAQLWRWCSYYFPALLSRFQASRIGFGDPRNPSRRTTGEFKESDCEHGNFTVMFTAHISVFFYSASVADVVVSCSTRDGTDYTCIRPAGQKGAPPARINIVEAMVRLIGASGMIVALAGARDSSRNEQSRSWRTSCVCGSRGAGHPNLSRRPSSLLVLCVWVGWCASGV